ncbi:MAG: hypothetical protein JXR05_13690 [Flavobacteriaceae bacterium]
MNRKITIIVIIAFITIITIEFYLDTIPEIFPWGNDLGNIIYGVCLSIVAGFIFYFFTTYIPQKEAKKKLKPIIDKNIEKIHGSFLSLIKQLQKDTDFVFNEIPNENEFVKLLDSKSIHEKVNVIDYQGNYYTFIKYFLVKKRDVQHYINTIQKYKEWTSIETLLLLNELETSGFFSQTEMMNNVKLKIADIKMSKLSGSFYSAFKIAKDLNTLKGKKA